MTEFRQSKLYDVAVVSPLIVWYGLGIWGQVPNIESGASAFAAHPGLAPALELASLAATLAFLGLQIVLFLIRRVPEARAEGILPRLAAVVGSNIQLTILAIPRAEGSVARAAAATGLIAVGMIAAVAIAFWLGRSFSVFPQARRLVVKGPYRLVRHPLYLAEQIATLGVVLQYTLPWSALVGLASFAAQFPRMHFEEQILARHYRQYADYAARTRYRLIPGLY